MTAHELPRPVPFEIDRVGCLALLRSARLGRVVVHGDGPGAAEVMPMNFVMDASAVVLRTGEGSVLAAARAGRVLTFQVDDLDEQTGGWSVTAAGRSREALGVALEHARGLPLIPFAGGQREHFVYIDVESVEGRRVAGPVPLGESTAAAGAWSVASSVDLPL